MTGKLFFNAVDGYSTYGVLLQDGAYDEILKFPGAWPEEERKLAVPMIIEAANEVEFNSRLKAFRTLLTAGNEFTLEVRKIRRKIKVKYEGLNDLKMLTPATGRSKIMASFKLELMDDYPDVYTATKTGSFTPAGGGTAVTFTRTYSSFSQADANAMRDADTQFNADGQAYANS